MAAAARSYDGVRGNVDEGYGAVADAFRRNLAEQDEIGAACAVYAGGRLVVDLWGGYADGPTRRPWRQDTVVTMFSTTKGIAGLTLALAHSRGWLAYDRPVADYWPEFGWRGKGQITVRQLLAHQAGLPVIDLPLGLADLADREVLAAAIVLQRPLWTPGTRHAYHGITLGWYEGELLRRVDPAHRSLGRFLAEEIAGPLGADFHIGLPEEFDLGRRATIHGRSTAQALLHLGEVPRPLLRRLLTPGSLAQRAFSNPKELSQATNFNDPALLRIEVPAGNGTGEPRAVAAIYGAVAAGRVLAPATLAELAAPARPPSLDDTDLIMGIPIRYSLGFAKPSAEFPLGSSDAAFGTAGNGGSLGLADPATGIGYCYVPNRHGSGLTDPREIALRDALFHSVLGERSQQPRLPPRRRPRSPGHPTSGKARGLTARLPSRSRHRLR